MIKVLGYIDYLPDLDLGDVFSLCNDAQTPGSHVRIVTLADGEEACVVYVGPEDASDADIIAADAGLGVVDGDVDD